MAIATTDIFGPMCIILVDLIKITKVKFPEIWITGLGAAV